jgi:hypothetical protein
MAEVIPIDHLLVSDRLKKILESHFNVSDIQELHAAPLKAGMCKQVWKVSSPQLPHEFIVKEIRLLGKSHPHQLKETNHTLSVSEALYEVETIRAINKNNSLKDNFPANIGFLVFKHPEYNEDNQDRIKRNGVVVPLKQAESYLTSGGDGSVFIIEEVAHGRAPNGEEVQQAHEMRMEGIRKDPRIWLTVDTAGDDFFVKDDGSFIFYDCGHFGNTLPEEITLKNYLYQKDLSFIGMTFNSDDFSLGYERD